MRRRRSNPEGKIRSRRFDIGRRYLHVLCGSVLVHRDRASISGRDGLVVGSSDGDRNGDDVGIQRRGARRRRAAACGGISGIGNFEFETVRTVEICVGLVRDRQRTPGERVTNRQRGCALLQNAADRDLSDRKFQVRGSGLEISPAERNSSCGGVLINIQARWTRGATWFVVYWIDSDR